MKTRKKNNVSLVGARDDVQAWNSERQKGAMLLRTNLHVHPSQFFSELIDGRIIRWDHIFDAAEDPPY